MDRSETRVFLGMNPQWYSSEESAETLMHTLGAENARRSSFVNQMLAPADRWAEATNRPCAREAVVRRYAGSPLFGAARVRREA